MSLLGLEAGQKRTRDARKYNAFRGELIIYFSGARKTRPELSNTKLQLPALIFEILPTNITLIRPLALIQPLTLVPLKLKIRPFLRVVFSQGGSYFNHLRINVLEFVEHAPSNATTRQPLFATAERGI